MTDHERILSWLVDGEYHCSTELEFCRDARKRRSELNAKFKPDKLIEGIPCDGRCGKVHKSKTLLMWRLNPLVGSPTGPYPTLVVPKFILSHLKATSNGFAPESTPPRVTMQSFLSL